MDAFPVRKAKTQFLFRGRNARGESDMAAYGALMAL